MLRVMGLRKPQSPIAVHKLLTEYLERNAFQLPQCERSRPCTKVRLSFLASTDRLQICSPIVEKNRLGEEVQIKRIRQANVGYIRQGFCNRVI